MYCSRQHETPVHLPTNCTNNKLLTHHRQQSGTKCTTSEGHGVNSCFEQASRFMANALGSCQDNANMGTSLFQGTTDTLTDRSWRTHSSSTN